MAVSLPPCGVKVTIISSATCSHLRRGDSAGVRCRELSLEVVDSARVWKRKGQGLARVWNGGEGRRCRKERCAVSGRFRISHNLLKHNATKDGCAVAFASVLNIYLKDAPLKDAYPVSNISCPNHTLCLQQLRREMRGFEQLFNPGDFDPSKLTVKFEDNASISILKSVEDLLPRKYTLTHSDVTGELLLSIGPSFNRLQLTDWYTRLMRDEILAEWRGSEQISLHVHCHVSGGHVLLAPAALRNSIFEREMPLVLEAIRHGDKDLLAEYPELHASTVWVHFHSSDPAYNRADCWGPLFYAASPVRRVTGKLVPSCISEPFTPLTLVKVQKDAAELYSVMSP